MGDRVGFQCAKCPIVFNNAMGFIYDQNFELSVHMTSNLMIILSIWMANILHTMHKCARVFLRGEGEVASPCISPYPGSRARIRESVYLGSKH